jgi:hypothetical protein
MPPYGQSRYSDVVPARGARRSPRARRGVEVVLQEPTRQGANELFYARQAALADNEAQNQALVAQVEAEAEAEARPRRRPTGTLVESPVEAGEGAYVSPYDKRQNKLAEAGLLLEEQRDLGYPALVRAGVKDAQRILSEAPPRAYPFRAESIRPVGLRESQDIQDANPLPYEPVFESTKAPRVEERAAAIGRTAQAVGQATKDYFEPAVELTAKGAPAFGAAAAEYFGSGLEGAASGLSAFGQAGVEYFGAPTKAALEAAENAQAGLSDWFYGEGAYSPEAIARQNFEEGYQEAAAKRQQLALPRQSPAAAPARVASPAPVQARQLESAPAPITRGGGGPLLPAGWGAMALSQARRRPAGQLRAAAPTQAPAPGEARRFKVSAGDTLIKMEGEAPELYYSTDQGDAMLAEWEAAAAEEARMKTPAADGGSRSATLREGVGTAISNGEKVRSGVNKRAAAALAAQANEEALGAELGNIWESSIQGPSGFSTPDEARAKPKQPWLARQEEAERTPGRSRLEAQRRGAPSPYELTQRGLASAEKSQRWGYAGDVPTLDEQLRRKVVKYAGRPEAEAAFLGEMGTNQRERERGASEERRQRMVSDSARDQETTRAMGGVAEKQIQAGVDLANKSAELEEERYQNDIKNNIDSSRLLLDLQKANEASGAKDTDRVARLQKDLTDIWAKKAAEKNKLIETLRRNATAPGQKSKLTEEALVAAADAAFDKSPEGMALNDQADRLMAFIEQQSAKAGLNLEEYRPKSGRTRGGMASILDVADRKKSPRK